VRRKLVRDGLEVLGFDCEDHAVGLRHCRRSVVVNGNPEVARNTIASSGIDVSGPYAPGFPSVSQQAADQGARHVSAADERDVHA